MKINFQWVVSYQSNLKIQGNTHIFVHLKKEIVKRQLTIIMEEQKPMNMPTLDPMVFHQRFSLITEQIFEKMDENSLKNCRKVAKSWQNCIDNRNILWNKIAEKNGGNASFLLACQKGHFKMAKMLIQKSDEFKIDVNAKNEYGETHFFYGL